MYSSNFLPAMFIASLAVALEASLTAPIGRSILESVTAPGVSISYKQVRSFSAPSLSTSSPSSTPWSPLPFSIAVRRQLTSRKSSLCETTPGVKAYSGYVHLPANTTDGRDYDVNSFFIFFESRKDPANAPLSLWLQGGPGSPSTPAAIGENGPCAVLRDSKSTKLNPWSWSNTVNMLYLDQPVQVGFSYDRLINGTINEVKLPFLVTPEGPDGLLPQTDANLAGVFPSQAPSDTAPTTGTAAVAAWQFMQVWMRQFPHHRPKNDKISIWGESYGGHYVPTFASFFEAQNDLVEADGAGCGIKLKIDTVGLINACIDTLTQMPFYPIMANNNTYGLKLMSEEGYASSKQSFPECEKKVEECQSLAYRRDPSNLGINDEVNKVCAEANEYCYDNIAGPYVASGRNVFDIGNTNHSSFPPNYAGGFLNTKEVQEDFGVPLNFSGYAMAVAGAFNATGDFALGRNLAILGELLDAGTKVALVYGDLDYQCNWYGGEAISNTISSSFTPAFAEAGYTKIHINDTYIGGMVRQAGNLSFTRVFQAGHQVPYYQRETAFKIFDRVMSDKDIATGNVSTADNGEKAGSLYQTKGPKSIANVSHDVPPQAPDECYFWNIYQTCTKDQIRLITKGQAIFKDYIMVGTKGDATNNV